MYQDGVLETEFQKLQSRDPEKLEQLKELDRQETYWQHNNHHELVITNGRQAWHLDTWDEGGHAFKDTDLLEEESLIAAGYRRTDFETAERMADRRMIELKRPSVQGLEDYLWERKTAMAEKSNKYKGVAERMAALIENDPDQQKRLAEWETQKNDDGRDAAEKARQNARELALDKYRQVYRESLDMRTEFAGKPGYVRQKSAEERAYHAAKASFGEFSPNDRNAMQNNTNKGKGAQVKLADGKIENIENQLQLYDKIVAFNKRYGSFYDEALIQKASEADYYRLQQNQKKLNEAKKAVIDSFADKADAYKALKQIETAMKEDKTAQTRTEQPPVRETDRRGPQSRTGRKRWSRPAAAANANELANDGDIDESRIRDPERGLIDKFDVIKKRSQQHYYWKDSDRMAFADKGARITTQSNATVIAQSIVEVADSKGWSQIKVKGHDTFRRTVWMEASMRGIDVQGYKPSPQDLQELEQRLAKENSVEAVGTKSPRQAEPDVESGTSAPVIFDDTAKENYRLINGLELNKNTQLAVRDHSGGHKTAAVLIRNGKTAEQYIYNLDMHNKAATPMAYHKAENGNTVENSLNLSRDQAAASEKQLRSLAQSERQANLDEKKEPEFQTGGRKARLKTAYLTMSKEAALDRYPELKELYELEAAAKELADKRIGHAESRTEYVTAIRERSLVELANGKRLPHFVQGRQMEAGAARTAEGPQYAER